MPVSISSLLRLLVLPLVAAFFLCLSCHRSESRTGSVDRKVSAETTRRHSGLKQKVRQLDEGALEFIEKLDGPGLLEYRRKTGITICGIYPIALLLTVLKDSGLPIGVRVLDYYTSGDTTGDWTNTVSYYSIAFYSKNGSRRVGLRSGEGKNAAAVPRRSGKTGRPAALGAGPTRDRLPVRPMVTGPGWYPKNAKVLRRTLDGFLKQVHGSKLSGPLVALISPHAGYRFSGAAAAHGYKLLGMDKAVQRVVILGVSHHVGFRGVSVADFRAYQTPFGPLAVDLAAGRVLKKHEGFGFLARAHAREHSIEMQMPFVALVQPKVLILPMLVGFVPANRLHEIAQPLLPLFDGATVFVASSDFTHRGPRYGYQPFARPVDLPPKQR